MLQLHRKSLHNKDLDYYLRASYGILEDSLTPRLRSRLQCVRSHSLESSSYLDTYYLLVILLLVLRLRMSQDDKDQDKSTGSSSDELRKILEQRVNKIVNEDAKSKKDSRSSSQNSHTTADDDDRAREQQRRNRDAFSSSDDDDKGTSFGEGFKSFTEKMKQKAQEQAQKAKGGNGGGNGPDFSGVAKRLPLVASLVVLAGIVFTGFYTVNESERGVVTRLGAYSKTTGPGLNWRIPLLDSVTKVNVQQVSEMRLDGTMLTRDENVVISSLNVQYRVADPVAYLFNVDDPVKTLKEATESSLRYVVGHMNMDEILTTGRAVVRDDTRKALEGLLDNYKAGIDIVDVNFQSARPPESVKEAFDDAIKAQEDEQRYIREAEAYQRSKEPIARGEAQQIIAQAEGYARSIVAKAEGDREFFNQLLPKFLAQPQIFKQRYYLQEMAQLYARTPKVILEEGVNLNFLSLDKILGGAGTPATNAPTNLTIPQTHSPLNYTPSQDDAASSSTPATSDSSSSSSGGSSSSAPSRFSGSRVGGSN